MHHTLKNIRSFKLSRLFGATLAVLAVLALDAGPVKAESDAMAPDVSAILSTVFTFGSNDQGYPSGQMAMGRDGDFYGINDGQQIFKVTPQGVRTVLWTAPSSASCFSGLTLGTDGDFYGTCTSYYGTPTPAYYGIVFKYEASLGQNGFTVLYQFPTASVNPAQNEVTEGTDGNFYGTTASGGTANLGVFFKITPAGVYTVLHSFLGYQESEGSNPSGPLTLGIDGNFYGTTQTGGNTTTGNAGTVYKMTPAGAMTVLYVFAGGTGPDEPTAGVIQGTDKNFYGTTYNGGASNQGTVFKLTKKGALTVLHEFDLSTGPGASPNYPLTQGTDGNLYGVATDCFVGGCGSVGGAIFEVSTKGTYTSLETFAPINGVPNNLVSPLLLDPSGLFYGLTQQGGSNERGTLYALGVGFSPLAELLPQIGAVGTTVGIYGQGLSTATAVAFKGTAATFTKVSDTYMTAIVPTGAKTGSVTVTTSSGTLTSNVKFTLLKSSGR